MRPRVRLIVAGLRLEGLPLAFAFGKAALIMPDARAYSEGSSIRGAARRTLESHGNERGHSISL